MKRFALLLIGVAFLLSGCVGNIGEKSFTLNSAPIAQAASRVTDACVLPDVSGKVILLEFPNLSGTQREVAAAYVSELFRKLGAKPLDYAVVFPQKWYFKYRSYVNPASGTQQWGTYVSVFIARAGSTLVDSHGVIRGGGSASRVIVPYAPAGNTVFGGYFNSSFIGQDLDTDMDGGVGRVTAAALLNLC